MGLLGHEVQAGMDAGDADEAKASGEENSGRRRSKKTNLARGAGSVSRRRGCSCCSPVARAAARR